MSDMAVYLSARLAVDLEHTYGQVDREDDHTLVVDVEGRGEVRVSVQPVAAAEAGVTRKPWVKAGDVIHGFCGGYFGRDATSCKRVEGVGENGDWVIARGVDGWQARVPFLAKGPGVAEYLRHFRERLDEHEGGTVCCEERP